MTQPNTALATRPAAALAGDSIRTPQELASRIRAWQQVAHVLSPAFDISAIAPSHAINVAVVPIDPTVEVSTGQGSDCYFQGSIHKATGFGDQRRPLEVSLAKVGLQKLSQAAGVSWVDSRRTDDGRQPCYWAWRAVGAYTAFDGSTQQIVGSVEIDLRDGSPQIGGWTPEAWAAAVRIAEAKRAQESDDKKRKDLKPEAIGSWTKDRVDAARRFGLRLAEAKAMNAAIRTLGLRQKYTVDELKKPFVVLRCSFVPDLNDPEVKRLVTAHALAGASALYAPRAFATAPDVIDVTPPGQPAAQPAAAPPPVEPDELGDLPVMDQAPLAAPPVPEIFHVTFVGKRGAGAATIYVIKTDRTGERELETPDRALAVAAKHAKDAGTPVDLDYERVEDGGREQWVLTAIAPITQSAADVASATLSPGTTRITTITSKSGTTNNRPWTRYTIVAEDAASYVTFSDSVAKDAEAARAAGLPVRLQSETNEKYPDQRDLVALTVIDTRQQTLPMDAGDKL